MSEPTTVPSLHEASAVPVFQERRRKRRTKMKLTARIRPYSFCQGLLEEVRATADFSRAGLSFVTRQRSYREGMHVYVACPYSQYHADKEGDLARVVRVEERNEGQWEVAIEFVKSSEYNAYHRGESF